MPLGSIAKRFRRSRHHSEQRTEESGGIRPTTSAGQGRGGEHAPTLSEESQPGFLVPDNAAEFQSTSVQMSIPMSATAQVVEIEADMVEATEDRRSDGASVLEEPSRALSLLGQEIEQRYNTRPRDAAKSEGHAEELMHVRIDPVFKHIDIKQAIEAGVDRFSDSIPILRKALSDLSKIHPIVTVAVLAFEAVIELEITRRENDRRVTVLFVEMKQVMSVITHFKELRADDIGRDGRMLGVRLRELAEGTAEDIKHCANLCDAFLKSKMLLRVLKGPLWAERFATSMQRFARRKEEYSLALAMHTADTTTKMAVDIESINYKMQLMHDLFQKYMTSSERALAAEVEKEGGLAKVRNDDAVLRRLMGTATVKDSITGVKPTEDRDRGTQAGVAPVSRKRSQYRGLDTKARSERSFGLDDLKRELREDLDDTIERNFAIFLRKYDFQAQLMSDRIIHAVEAAVGNGTHSRIKNADLQRLWREMNWTGVVKGRILVHALREHYSQDDFVTTSPEAAAVMSDKWALDYLNIAWLHPIMEAIDDDTSGYISVSEVNRFMQRLPPELGWSLPHWLAFWAIGWKCATTMYLEEMQDIVRCFHEALPYIRAPNRPAVDAYLNFTTPTWTLMAGMERATDPYLYERFKAYVDMEEARLKANLEKFNYRIDAFDTLKLVIGSNRIERCIAPLLCLLLRNDFRKIKAARSFILAEDEFYASQTSMSIIDVALAQRHAELRETFVQRKLDPSVEIQRFASGMLTYFDRENLTIDGNWWVQAGTAIDLVYVASAWPDSHFAEEPADIQGIGVLHEHPLDTSVYDVVECETEDDLSCGPALAAIAGTWNGFLYEDNLYPSRPMTTITFHAAPPNAELQKEDPNVYGFVSEGTDYDGAEYIVNGTCTTSEDGSTIEVKWCMEYDGDVTIWFVGCLLDQFTLSGDQRLTEHERSPGDSYLILKKAPTDYLCFRPAPFELQSQPHPLLYPISDVTPESRARALWRYALNAVQHDVRRKWWTWSYFEERRRVRRLWFDIRCRELDGPLDFRELHQRTTSADARVYFDATEYVNKEQNCYTTNWACEGPGCGRYLRITIVVCLECLSDDFRHAIAFCDNPKCYGTDDLLDRTLPNGLPPHRASHTLIKFRTTMLHAYWPSVKQRAFADLQQAMWLLSQSENVLPVQYSPGASSVLLPVDEAEGEAAPPPSTAQREDATGEDQYLSLNENMKAEEYANPNSPCLSPPIKLSGEGTLSKWSLRLLLPSAWRKPLTGGPPASAADASSTLAPSHLNRSDSPDADATPGGDAPSHSSASPQGCRRGSVNEEQPPPQPTDLSRSRRSGPEGDGDDGAAHSDSDDGTSSKDVPSLYATAPPSFRSSSSRAVSLMIPPRYDVCSVCTAPVLMGCWFCMLCNVFICTACDAQRNIMCVTCGKPFPQPSWYYGMGPLDNFQCDVCCATRRPLPPSWDLARPHPHVHTHPVLLCKQPPPPQPDESEQGAPEPPPPPPVTSPIPGSSPPPPPPPLSPSGSVGVDAQLAALEGKIGEMGARLGQLDEVQGQLAQIQAMMARLLEQQGAAADSRST